MPERMDERLQAAEWAASTNAEAQAELPPTPYRWVALDGDPPLGVLFTIDDPNTCQLRHVLALDENLGYPDESQLGASYGAEEDDEPEPSA